MSHTRAGASGATRSPRRCVASRNPCLRSSSAIGSTRGPESASGPTRTPPTSSHTTVGAITWSRIIGVNAVSKWPGSGGNRRTWISDLAHWECAYSKSASRPSGSSKRSSATRVAAAGRRPGGLGSRTGPRPHSPSLRGCWRGLRGLNRPVGPSERSQVVRATTARPPVHGGLVPRAQRRATRPERGVATSWQQSDRPMRPRNRTNRTIWTRGDA